MQQQDGASKYPRGAKVGKEGKWPDLEDFAEKRLIEVLPSKERKLYLAQHTDPSYEDVAAARNDVSSFLADIREKDRKFKELGAPSSEKSVAKVDMPPVRNAPESTEQVNEKAAAHTYDTISDAQAERLASKKSERLSGYDWRAWEKYDVDAELEKMDKEDAEKKKAIEESVKAGERRRKERLNRMQAQVNKLGLKIDVTRLNKEEREYLARKEKEKGNECFRAGEYDEAELFYSKAIVLDEQNAVMWANRAMVRLKTKRFELAEEDCTHAIERDPHVKAISRRARRGIAAASTTML